MGRKKMVIFYSSHAIINYFYMKKESLIFFCCLIALYANAQINTLTQIFSKQIVLDTAKYKITYQMKFPIVKGDSLNDDIRVILIGGHLVKDYSYKMFISDSLATQKVRRGADSYKGLKGQIYPYEIYNNYSAGHNLIVYRAILNMGNYQYEEPTPSINWKLSPDEHKAILGYICNKATTTYAGRNYTAWYALELPLNAGPFKFSGLPGLIMQVEESEHKYYWEIKGLEIVNYPIYYYTYTYPKLTKTTREKTRALMDKIFASPIVMYKLLTGYDTMYQNKDGSYRVAGKADDHPIDYERIERE